jgi:hypothetical protein
MTMRACTAGSGRILLSADKITCENRINKPPGGMFFELFSGNIPPGGLFFPGPETIIRAGLSKGAAL